MRSAESRSWSGVKRQARVAATAAAASAATVSATRLRIQSGNCTPDGPEGADGGSGRRLRPWYNSRTPERCPSGRRGRPAKALYGLKPVSRVRIPLSPPPSSVGTVRRTGPRDAGPHGTCIRALLPTRMRRRSLVLTVLVVILLLPVALFGGAGLLVQSTWGERQVERLASKALDREVEVNGISLRWGLPPGVVFAH